MAVNGERRFREGEREAGAREIQAALAVTPPRSDLLYYAVHALIRTGEHEVALGAWERLKRIRSMEDPAMVMLGAELDLSRGLVQSALKRLEGKELPTRGRLLRAAGLLETGRPKQVLEELADDESMVANVYKQMATLTLSAEAPLEPLKELARSSALAQLLLVRALLARQKLDEARTEVKALTNRPLFRNPALTALARIYLSTRGKLGQALITIESVLSTSPGYLPAREVLGEIYLAAGRYQDAVQQLSKVTDAGRTTLSLLSALARAQAMHGSTQAAKATMKQAEALGAPAEEIRRIKGFTQLAEGRAAEAVQMLKGATDLVGQIALGRVYLEAGDPRSSQRVLQNAAAAHPSHPLPRLWLGQVQQSKQKSGLAHFRAAIERTKRRPELYPRSNIARAYIGIARPLLGKKRRHPALIMNLKAAIAADRANAEAWKLLGQAHLAAKRYRQARDALEVCAKLDPKDATAFFLLGTAVKNPRARARTALQRFLELETNGPRAKQARRQLRRLR
jgi:tetratricopeptide (TPR) repeat protein